MGKRVSLGGYNTKLHNPGDIQSGYAYPYALQWCTGVEPVKVLLHYNPVSFPSNPIPRNQFPYLNISEVPKRISLASLPISFRKNRTKRPNKYLQ